VSLLIFAGIISATPASIRQLVLTWDISRLPSYLFFFGVALVIIAGVVLVNEARRNIPVFYAKRVRGHRMYGGSSTYLPININPAGVIPIIFALSLLLFPSMIANFVASGGNQTLAGIAQGINNFLQNAWVYGSLFLYWFFFSTFFSFLTSFKHLSYLSFLLSGKNSLIFLMI